MNFCLYISVHLLFLDCCVCSLVHCVCSLVQWTGLSLVTNVRGMEVEGSWHSTTNKTSEHHMTSKYLFYMNLDLHFDNKKFNIFVGGALVLHH